MLLHGGRVISRSRGVWAIEYGAPPWGGVVVANGSCVHSVLGHTEPVDVVTRFKVPSPTHSSSRCDRDYGQIRHRRFVRDADCKRWRECICSCMTPRVDAYRDQQSSARTTVVGRRYRRSRVGEHGLGPDLAHPQGHQVEDSHRPSRHQRRSGC